MFVEVGDRVDDSGDLWSCDSAKNKHWNLEGVGRPIILPHK